MIVHTLKFTDSEVLEVYSIFVGFSKIFMGSIFWGSPCNGLSNAAS